MDIGQKPRPVGHMLEHLHRDDAVEAARDGEIVHVGGDDLEIDQATFCGAALDMHALRGGVRYCGDTRRGKALGHP